MNQLDRLERHFRALFETSAAILPWTNPNDRIVHQLCIAIQDLFVSNIHENQLVAPNFIINLHPLTLNRWRNQQDWQKILSDLLISTAAEYNKQFHSSPTVELIPDLSLEEDEVAIFLKQSPGLPQTETGVMSLFSTTEKEGENPEIESLPILILKGDRTIQLTGNVINIGRKNSNHIVINDPRISRNHAQIRKVRDEFVIFDVGSSGGTFINSNRIDQHTLRPGDVISLAGYTLIYTIDQLPREETQKGITSEIKPTDEGDENS